MQWQHVYCLNLATCNFLVPLQCSRFACESTCMAHYKFICIALYCNSTNVKSLNGISSWFCAGPAHGWIVLVLERFLDQHKSMHCYLHKITVNLLHPLHRRCVLGCVKNQIFYLPKKQAGRVRRNVNNHAVTCQLHFSLLTARSPGWIHSPPHCVGWAVRNEEGH